jgi:hypothetical protein
MNIELKQSILNGKPIAYSSATVFEVQVGYKQGKYKNRYSFEGNLEQAVFYYNGINIGNGFKKRLYCGTLNKTTLAKQFS